MAGRVEIKDYGSKVVLQKGGEDEEDVVLALTPSPAAEDLEASLVLHLDLDVVLDHSTEGEPSQVAFIGTNYGVFVVDVVTGEQISQLLGNDRRVECFQLISRTLYVGVKDVTQETDNSFGLWAVDLATMKASPIKKVGDWDVIAMTLNSTQTQMAATYCDISNGNYWFEVHLFGVEKDGSISYQGRIGGDGWGKVHFSDDDNSVLIDKTAFPIPSKYLETSVDIRSCPDADDTPSSNAEDARSSVSVSAEAAGKIENSVESTTAAAASTETTLGKRMLDNGDANNDSNDSSKRRRDR